LNIYGRGKCDRKRRDGGKTQDHASVSMSEGGVTIKYIQILGGVGRRGRNGRSAGGFWEWL